MFAIWSFSPVEGKCLLKVLLSSCYYLVAIIVVINSIQKIFFFNIV